LIFLGSSAFAVPSLQAVAELGFHPLVITKPDKPARRGQKLTGTALKEKAEELQLSLLQPVSLKEPELVEAMKKENPELIISIAYGGYIPPEILDIPKLGTINLHPSLLPKYRGAAPVERALMAGEVKTGVTLAYVSPEWDAGDVLAQIDCAINPEDDAGTLLAKLAEAGASLLKKQLPLILDGKAVAHPQDHPKATMAPKIAESETWIDWQRPAQELVNQVRGLSPHRAVQTRFRDKLLKIYKAAVVPVQGTPGFVAAVTPEGPAVAAKKEAVLLLKVKPENRKEMSGRDFVNGYAIEENKRF